MQEQTVRQAWQEKVKSYPDKALIQVLWDIKKEQEKRIGHLQAQLDGQAWSPKDWANKE